MRPFTTDPGWYERHWFKTAPRRPPSGTPSIWTLTFGLVAYFLGSSFAGALLATYFGWLR